MTWTDQLTAMKVHRRNTANRCHKMTSQLALSLMILSVCFCQANAGGAIDVVTPTAKECEGKVDLVFLIDASSSIGKDTFEEITNFVKNLYLAIFESLGDELSVGVIFYASTVYDEKLHLTAGRDETLPHFMTQFKRNPKNIRTNTAAGINEAMTMFAEESLPSVTRIMLLITDGASDDKLNTMEAVDWLRTTDIHVLCIGVGSSTDLSELRAIASRNTAVFFPSTSMMQSDSFHQQIKSEMCSETQYKNDPDRFQAVAADVYFLLDETVLSDDYNIMKNFIKAIIGRFVVGADAAQFGVTGYSDMVFPYIKPGMFRLESTLYKAIDQMQRPLLIPKGRDMDLALNWLVNATAEVYDPDRIKIGVLFSSGPSTTNASSIASMLIERGVVLFVVTLGGSTSEWKVSVGSLASDPRLVLLGSSFADIILSNQNQVRLNYISQTLHSIANGSFVIEGFNSRWRHAFDVVFLIDGSTNYASNIEFSLTKHVIKEMIEMFVLGVDSGRVGVMVYDSISAYEVIPLGGYQNRLHLLDMIDGLVNIERTQIADNLVGMHAAIEHFAKNGRDAMKVCYLFTASSSSQLQLSQVIQRKAHLIHQIFMRPIYIQRQTIPAVPVLGELFDGQVATIINQDSADGHTLGSSQIQTFLNDLLKTDVEGGVTKQFGPWSYGFDMIVLFHDVVDQRQARDFLTDLVSRFAIQVSGGTTGMLLGVMVYGDSAPDMLQSATKIPIGGWQDIDARIQALTVNTIEGVYRQSGVLDLVSMFDDSGRSGPVNRLVVLVMEDDSDINAQLQMTVKQAAAGGVKFATVGLRMGSHLESLQGLASHPELAFPMHSLTLLSSLEAAIVALATDSFKPLGPSPYLRSERVCTGTSGIVFMIDASAKSQHVMEQVKAFVSALMDGFDLTTVEVGVLGYAADGVLDDTVIELGGLTRFGDLYIVFNTYMQTQAGSLSTSAHEGVEKMTRMFSGKYYGKKYAVLFTNGVPDPFDLTEQAIKDAQLAGIDVAIINTAGDLTNSQLLHALGEDLVFEFDDADLTDIVKLEEVQSIICDMIEDIARKCSKSMDLVLVIDSSISIASDNFNLLKLFLWKLVERFHIGVDLTRIGVVTIGDGIDDFTVPLSQSFNKQQIQLPIIRLKSDETSTNTGAAIERMTQMFKDGGRDLLTVPWIALVMSDGKSSNMQKTAVQSVIAHLNNIHVVSIGLGTNAYLQELNAISSTGSPLQVFTSYEDLYNSDTIGDHICGVAQRYKPPNTTVPETFVCQHAMEIVVIRDLGTPRAIGQFSEFIDKLKKNFGEQPTSRVDVLVPDSTLANNVSLYFQQGVLRLDDRSPNQSTRLLILVTNRPITVTEKSNILSAATDAKKLGILVIVVDAATPSNAMEAVPSTPALYFQTEEFHTDQELEISCCIASCAGGFQKQADNDAITCHECPLNQYRNPLESYLCVTCPGDMITKQIGSSSPADCVPDPDGIIDLLRPACGAVINDIVFVLDVSRSINDADVNQLKMIMKLIINELKESMTKNNTKVGIVQFAKEATEVHAISNDFTKIMSDCNNIAAIPERTGTYTHLGISLGIAMAQNQGRPGVAKTLVLVTDGKSENRTAVEEEARIAASSMIRLVCVGVDSYALAELNSIKSDNRSILMADNFNDLKSKLDNVLEIICEEPCYNGTEKRQDGTCKPCSAGQYRLDTETFTCQTCLAGQTSNVGATQCTDIVGPICDSTHPCENGGVCLDGPPAVCDCQPGFQGKTCQDNINECEGDPCLNAGTCVYGVNGYTCDCVEGYTGTLCSHVCSAASMHDAMQGYAAFPAADEMYPNQATCLWNITFSTARRVKIVFTRLNVESSPNCQKDSVMINDGSNPDLICGIALSTGLDSFSRITQPTRELNIQFSSDSTVTGNGFALSWNVVYICEPNPCVHGVCSAIGDSYVCTCVQGYTGNRCDIPNPCASTPCLNGGACSFYGSSYICQCPTSYTGNNCEISTPCASTPCLNGGTCSFYGSSYICQCPTSYTGNNCEISTPCASTPCLNGGTCSVSGGSYICQCPTSFTGNNCETNTGDNECSSMPCLNGGQCEWGVPFKCICPSSATHGFTGINCDTQVNCAEGRHWNQLVMDCIFCPNGLYRAASDADCRTCPAGQTTGKLGSTSVSDCTADICPSGQQLLGGWCLPCPVNTYKNKRAGDVICVSCPAGFVTNGIGKTDVSFCLGYHCRSMLDLVIVLDLSPSMDMNLRIQTVQFLRRLMDGFGVGQGTRVSIIRFAQYSDMVISLKVGDRKSFVVHDIATGLHSYQSSQVNAVAGLEHAFTELECNSRRHAKKAVLYISDEHATDLVQATDVARKLETHFHAEITAIVNTKSDGLNLRSNRVSDFYFDGAKNYPHWAPVTKNICETEGYEN